MKLSHIATIAVAMGCGCAFAGDYENGAAHVQAGNLSEALGPLDNAATKGDVRAQALLASLYYHGNGVPKDAKLAATWYQRAASQGYALAQLGLGTLYLRGEGVTQDYEVGFRLVRLDRKSVV